MTILRFLLVFAVFSASSVRAQEYDLFDSAKLEAEEFVDEILKNHLDQFLPESHIALDNFSCHIPKDLLYGFIPTHRDIQATFYNGRLSGPFNLTKQRCNPVMKEPNGLVSMVCRVRLEMLPVTYSANVKGFDLKGSHSQAVLRAQSTQVLTVIFGQKRPAPPAVDSVGIMINRISELEYGNFGFNKARRERLRVCVDHHVRQRLAQAVPSHIEPAIKKALLANNRDLPEARLDNSDSDEQ